MKPSVSRTDGLITAAKLMRNGLRSQPGESKLAAQLTRNTLGGFIDKGGTYEKSSGFMG